MFHLKRSATNTTQGDVALRMSMSVTRERSRPSTGGRPLSPGHVETFLERQAGLLSVPFEYDGLGRNLEAR